MAARGFPVYMLWIVGLRCMCVSVCASVHWAGLTVELCMQGGVTDVLDSCEAGVLQIKFSPFCYMFMYFRVCGRRGWGQGCGDRWSGWVGYLRAG